jgi:hypothetical protein
MGKLFNRKLRAPGGRKQMRNHLDTRRGRAGMVLLLLVVVAAIAVPSAALGKSSRVAGTCNGLKINNFSPQIGGPGTVVTLWVSHLQGTHYLNVFFKRKGGWQWVHHSDYITPATGPGGSAGDDDILIVPAPPNVVTGPIAIRDGSGCKFSYSEHPFKVQN